MIQQPHFHSHAEQIALLGSAAELDPVKFPRRYALERSRNQAAGRRATSGEHFRQLRAAEAEHIRNLAKTMSITQAHEHTGMDRKRLRLIAQENGFDFLRGGVQ